MHNALSLLRQEDEPSVRPVPLSGPLQFARRMGILQNILNCPDAPVIRYRAIENVMELWEWEDMLAVQQQQPSAEAPPQGAGKGGLRNSSASGRRPRMGLHCPHQAV